MTGTLTVDEFRYLKEKLSREPNSIELDIVGAEWSEHCSYKSSKKYVRMLPSKGKRVVIGPGYDAGVLDVGDGYVVTVHIESHNHPSAVEPFGGAATGVGGVIRDIMSMGTRPIAVLDALRFAPITQDGAKRTRTTGVGGKGRVLKSKWLFKNVVKGIADYGNCIGIPTVGGEVEFDPSFEDYCLVDVASIGFGRRDLLVKNAAEPDDIVVLAGGSTGRDGIHGASFASKALEGENRSAVQIPDPFLEKLLLEATIEAVDQKCVKAIKDLGGGGLACCLSEVSDSIGNGLDVDVAKVHARESGMSPAELMISESQERMLFITDDTGLEKLKAILEKYRIPYSILGSVRQNPDLVVRFNHDVVARMPFQLVAHAPLAERQAKRPHDFGRYVAVRPPALPKDLGKVLLAMLANPTIAGKGWIYSQYDHEVGVRTVVKPGPSDASVLRLDNGKFIAAKLDGNSKHCFLDPYAGTMGCLSESCRNIVCSGAEPIGIVDHLQFGNPEDPEIFWSFTQAVNAIIDYCKYMGIPVVGGKVSFYNETAKGPIKPSPVIGALGLIEQESWITKPALKDGDSIFVIGKTGDEMGGSEYYEWYHHITGGTVPSVDLHADKQNADAVMKLVRAGLVGCAHDCSKGGIAVALSEMAVHGKVGFDVNLDQLPGSCSRPDNLMFSESNSRYIIGTARPAELHSVLSGMDRISFAEIGTATGQRQKQSAKFSYKGRTLVSVGIADIESNLNDSLAKIMKQ